MSLFTVFTNERGDRVPGLHQFGAVRSTVVYDIFKFTCDDEGSYARGGALPGRSAYQDQVHAYIEQFGGRPGAPVVLDFEDILLTELSGPAAHHALGLWQRLISWTKEAVPGSPVGMYGFDWRTTNSQLTRELYANGLLDFFAPEAYWWQGQTEETWTRRFDASVANARALAPGKPVYPYFHPRYIDGGYLPAHVWSASTDRFKELADGVVIWEPSANGADSYGWVSQYAHELSTPSGTADPPTVTLQPRTAARGSTTALTLTMTDPSGTVGETMTVDITVPPAHGYSTIPLRLALDSREVCLGVVVE
ncbi:hypothetical protein OHT59_01455 [Streptomyces sp. NBC_00243]|uniref:hypothetical protein n=1 Tax=Streptomyces sp. NBC_00243 TaxID=2975688 RepID=UPI002DD87B79|nr:hypothetical protein [Streptomyces sp. NBC_00243]WRZ17240.1 hypothetical protein OHT59_01455 [Streptomyces sp. NBC_00243]